VLPDARGNQRAAFSLKPTAGSTTADRRGRWKADDRQSRRPPLPTPGFPAAGVSGSMSTHFEKE
jgi:hypothetical protein